VCSPSVWRHNVRAFSELVAFGVHKAWRGRSGPGRNGRIGPTRSSIGSTPCSYREGRTPNSVLDTTAMYRRIPRYCRLKQLQKIVRIMVRWLKGKGSPTRLPSVGFRSWSRFLAVGLHVTWVINPAVGCYQFRCMVNRGTMGVNSLLKTVTWQRRGCDLNPGPSAPESSTLTTRLPSHPD